MSQENVEIVKRMLALFHAGDVKNAIACFSEDVVAEATSRPDSTGGRGREALNNLIGSWVAAWEDWSEEIDEVRDLGDRVMVIATQRGRGKGTAIEIETHYAVVYEFRDGEISRMALYDGPAEALEAAGLAEQGDTAWEMSDENVEIVKSGFSALAQGDLEGFFSVLDAGVEWVNPPYAVEPGTRRGTAEFREALGRMRASFRGIRLKVDEVVEVGETVVVVTGRWTGEGTGSGIRLENPFSSLLTLRKGKVVRYEWFREKAEALEAAGLSE